MSGSNQGSPSAGGDRIAQAPLLNHAVRKTQVRRQVGEARPQANHVVEALHPRNGTASTARLSSTLRTKSTGTMCAMRREPHERLREARERAGFTGPAEAAQHFNWNENSYKSRENGKRAILPASAEKYAKAYHVKAGWILFEEGPGPELTPEEMSVLSKFRMMGESHKRVVLEMCDSLLSTIPEPNPRVVALRRRRS